MKKIFKIIFFKIIMEHLTFMLFLMVALSHGTTQWYPQGEYIWHYQLEGSISETTAQVITVDLFNTDKTMIRKLHSQSKKVICYFSAGSYENFRNDVDDFPKEILGNTLDGWEDEKWLDITSESLKPILINRFDIAKDKRCDGVEVDNIDGYQNNNGFKLDYYDQLQFNIWLAEQAHKRSLAIGLKNDLDQVLELVNYYDFAVNEQCLQYDECDLLKPFIIQNKSVFHIEYELSYKKFCTKSKSLQFSSVLGEYDLNGENLDYC